MTRRRLRQLQSTLQRKWIKLTFERSLHRQTKNCHDQILAEAESALLSQAAHESDEAVAASNDPLVMQGYRLKNRVVQEFKGMYAGKEAERILIQVPDPVYSPAGYSLFTNLAESLDFIGVPTCILGWDEDAGAALGRFHPTVLMTSDHPDYLDRIAWESVERYRQTRRLRVGLTATLEEYGSAPLGQRLEWAGKHGIDFYYSYRDESYVRGRVEYRPFFDAGYPMLYLPFSANVLHYYPVAGFKRDIDYVLIASKKKEHTVYLHGIAKAYYGFIDGPGWKHAPHFRFHRDRDRYVYVRAKAGLNVHLPEQIDWACEVNERTYQLAACGVPQIIDHPKLLDKLFGKNALFVADSPKQFADLFRMVMNDPRLAQERALVAQQDVFDRHTTFHRADALMRQLAALRPN